MDVDKHIDHHVVEGNRTPAEQIVRTLVFNRPVRSEKFREAIIATLLDYEGCYYKDHCFKKPVPDNLSDIK